MGVGDECGVERAGIGAGDRDRDPVRIDVTLACGAVAYLAAMLLLPTFKKAASSV